MGISLWLALRHLAQARRGGFLGRVSLLALLGVAIGVATLLTVFAFVQGFQAEVRDLLTGMNPAVFVSSLQRGGIESPARLSAELMDFDGVAAAGPFIQQNGVISRRDGRDVKLRGAILRGIDAELEMDLTRILATCDPPFSSFKLPDGGAGVLLGRKLGEELGVLPGETVTFTTILDELSGDILQQDFTIVGFVSLGLHEFDLRFAYADVGFCRDLLRGGLGVDGIGLRLDDVMAADELSARLRGQLDYTQFQVASWRQLNADIFAWMETMRAVLFVVLSLIILVAGFNIAGSMTIIVTEKTREIGLLLSLGARRMEILGIYLIEGWLIGLGGVLSGTLFSLALMEYFKRHPLALPGEVYFIEYMPVRLSPEIFLAIGISALLSAFFALILPGLEALRRSPLDALTSGGRGV